jgi:hypothetical protein
MMQDIDKPETTKILAGLKDFQRSTVEHVFRRLYTDPDANRRFLVADEVGLGKTLIARGVIAKTIDHLWESTPRIDVVYVCSNTDIARQNINRLKVLGCNEFALSSRITLLPIKVASLEHQRVNFVSFTPGTSFDLKRSGGIAEERALIYWMLKDAWKLDQPIHSRPFEGTSLKKGFDYWLNLLNPVAGYYSIHADMQQAFINAVSANDALRSEYEKLVGLVPPRKEIPSEITSLCIAWIGQLRRVLAETCLHWLEPDLIILDEFQRFKHLMAGDTEDSSEAAALAEHLFNFQNETSSAKVLLLSATPYKMFTTADESASDDHYADFRLTLNFLISDAAKRSCFEKTLKQYREELFRVSDCGVDGLLRIKRELENLLRSVMVRTERLSIDANRDGMLRQMDCLAMSLDEKDVEHYLALQQIASSLEHGDMLEYWKSAPYLLNFMEHYDVKRKLEDAMEEQADSSLAKQFRNLGDGLLNRQAIEEYSKIDPGNARLRSLEADTLGKNAWKLLWIPPSLPYYASTGAFVEGAEGFTKRLVFSSWRVVPKAVASLLSYEAERLMMLEHHRRPKWDSEDRKKLKGLLKFSAKGDKPTSMTALGVLYPCRTLASQLDPRSLLGQSTRSKAEVLKLYSETIFDLLNPVLEKHREEQAAPTTDGTDDRWYWAAPLLLDLHFYGEQTLDWLTNDRLAEIWSGDALDGEEADVAEGWSKHVDLFKQTAKEINSLGNAPDDLSLVLAEMALAAPGIVALRCLQRVVDQAIEANRQTDIADYAAPLGHSMLTLFNLPEVMSLIRGKRDELPYWRNVLSYSIDGNIQSTFDEYVHTLVESLGLPGKPLDEFLAGLVQEVASALSLRTTNLQADVFECEGRRLQKESDPLRMRNRFALAFGQTKKSDDEDKTRPAQVRSSFNSPFWPFVLVSTSVGQEGLDFHPYCHAIVHWNLPSNPVDLEQREGRIHRYKGHALRKNIAQQFRSHATDSNFNDPWSAMFEEARKSRPDGQNDLYPFWISPDGDAKIERYVPRLPHSREVLQQIHLQRSLVLYRMVFGQHRQEDLINYLRQRFNEEQIAELVEICKIDLSPPDSNCSKQ